MEATIGHAHIVCRSDDEMLWLQERRNGIGGTDISAIAGINPWKSALAVYYEKTEAEELFIESERMRWGKIIEPLIIEQTAVREDIIVERVPFLLVHPECEWARATIDGCIRDKSGDGILEVKNLGHWSSSRMRQDVGEDSIADHYLLQLQWYFFVTGLNWGIFSALLEGSELRVEYVKRDDALIRDLVRLATDFWKCVQDKTPPAADGSESTSDVLKLMYPLSIEGEARNLTPEYEEILHERQTLKSEINERQTRLNEIDNKLKLALGTAELATCGPYRINYKSAQRDAYEVKATTARTMRITGG